MAQAAVMLTNAVIAEPARDLAPGSSGEWRGETALGLPPLLLLPEGDEPAEPLLQMARLLLPGAALLLALPGAAGVALSRPAIAIGHGRGAMAAVALLAEQPACFRGAILLRPGGVPCPSLEAADWAGIALLMVPAAGDAQISAAESADLQAALTATGATLTCRTLPVPLGHALSQVDLALAGSWLAGVLQA